jgi:hypothetical protein
VLWSLHALLSALTAAGTVAWEDAVLAQKGLDSPWGAALRSGSAGVWPNLLRPLTHGMLRLHLDVVFRLVCSLGYAALVAVRACERLSRNMLQSSATYPFPQWPASEQVC